jgi:hypothetical protein
MFPEEPIDERSAVRDPAPGLPFLIKARHLVYAQLIAVLPSILLGRCEVWGYSRVLMSGLQGVVLQPVTVVLFFSMSFFPLAIFVRSMNESPREKWAIATLPLSLGLSFVQFLALFPLVQ